MNPQIWWFLSRASGTAAWLLLTSSVLLGILLPAKMFPNQRPGWILDLHRWIGGLTVTFLALHLGGLALDSYVNFGWSEIFIPFASDWKPVPVALGIVAFWLLVVVQLSSALKKYLPRKLWRGLHFLSYPTFALTSLHGTLAGSDATSSWYFLSSLAAIAAVVFATIFRILAGRRRLTVSAQKKPTKSETVPVGV